MNRELSRILAYLQVSSIGDRYIEYLNAGAGSEIDKLHVAMHLQFVRSGWTSEQRIQMLDYLERARQSEGGGSYQHYVMQACRDFSKTLQEDEIPAVLANGASWPVATVGVFYKLPKKLDNATIQSIQQIDRQIQSKDDDAYKQLKVAIVAVLARSGDDESMAYLREIWERDPERRKMVAMGLAQKPSGDNWELLVRSLPELDGVIAQEVLQKLRTVARQPRDPEHFRQVILHGLALKDKGADDAIALLEHWTGEQLTLDGDSWDVAIKTWQDWFTRRFPKRPAAVLPVSVNGQKREFDELLKYLNSEEGIAGSAKAGAAIFTKAQCANCHRFDNRGESLGPDLSSIAKRFTRREILESIVYPSHVISSQYASQKVLTFSGKQYVGLVTPRSNGTLVILQADGTKVTIARDDVDEMQPSKTSSMPTGLLDQLTLEQIADLFAYMNRTEATEIARQPRSSRRQ